MTMLRRPGVLPFLAAETALYAAFLWRDLTAGSAGANSIKYASILLCALFAVLWALAGGGDRLTAGALVLTAGADVFLLLLDAHYGWGLLLFCGVQLCYFLRLRALGRGSLWGARLGLFLLSLAALRALGLLAPLDALALFYFVPFLCNLLCALFCPGGRAGRCFSLGLALYLCCDLCVAAYQFPGTFPPPLDDAVRVGMWLFYLPGQVLIALSALPGSSSRGDRV